MREATIRSILAEVRKEMAAVQWMITLKGANAMILASDIGLEHQVEGQPYLVAYGEHTQTKGPIWYNLELEDILYLAWKPAPVQPAFKETVPDVLQFPE